MANLKIVRGNTFALRVQVTAYDYEGNVIQDFDLANCTDVVAKLRKSYRAMEVESNVLTDNYLRVVFSSADQHNGNYGLEVTGNYGGVEWRFYNIDTFDIVETNIEANIPDSSIIDEDYYSVGIASINIDYIEIPEATTETAGLMSAADKAKLDEINEDTIVYVGNVIGTI